MKNIKWLVEDKINEIFDEIQTDENITNGDIAPLDAMRIETLIEQLADTIEAVIEYEKAQ